MSELRMLLFKRSPFLHISNELLLQEFPATAQLYRFYESLHDACTAYVSSHFFLPSVMRTCCFPSVVGCFHFGCFASILGLLMIYVCCACRSCPQLHRPSSSSLSYSSALSCWVFPASTDPFVTFVCLCFLFLLLQFILF